MPFRSDRQQQPRLSFWPTAVFAMKNWAINNRLSKTTTQPWQLIQAKEELTKIHKIVLVDKFRIIPLGFDLDRFRQNRPEKRTAFRAAYNLHEDEIAIGIIGRLTAIKNHELFMQSVRQIALKSSKTIRAFVIGDGERMDDLRQKAQAIEQECYPGLFVFTSWIRNVDDILPGLDLIALTSLNEGTPVSLIEAQASGVPVVTTNVGGVADVVQHGETGFIVDGFEPATFAEKLELLIENKEIREKMSQNGWNYVEHKFHYRRLCSEVADLYHELLAKKEKG